MLKDIIISFQAYLHTHRFIVKHKLWKWILVPGLIYGILFSLGIYLFWVSSSHVIEFMLQQTGIKAWMQQLQNSWLSFLLIFGQLILHLVLIMFYFSLFKYLFLIAGSPLFSYLSEKTEAIINGNDLPFNFKLLVKDMIRGIKLALRNMAWQTIYLVFILLMSTIPLIGWVAPLLALSMECYYLGFSMLDYSCERNKLSPAASLAFISRHKGLARGNGLIFLLMHLLLFVGWVLAPGYAIIAATISLYNAKTAELKPQ